MTLRHYVTDHPWRSAFVFLGIVVTVVLFAGVISEIFQWDTLTQIAVVDVSLGIAGIALVHYLGWWRNAGFCTGVRVTDIPLFIFPVTAALLSFTEGVKVTAPMVIIGFTALTLLVGFAEETWFRGLIFPTLLPQGILIAVVSSSLIFALPHLLNVLGGVWDPLFTAADTVAAFGLGVTFAALRLRTGSIWPIIGIHALVDFTSLVALGGITVHKQSTDVLISSVLVGIFFVAYGLYLIRRMIHPALPTNPPTGQES